MTEQVFTLPLTNVPQKFGITLGGRQVYLVGKYNEHCGWVLDIIDGITEEDLIACIPLVSGTDLLEQYEYLGIPGSLVIYTDGDQFADPTENNLGIECNLYYLVDV